MIKKTSYLYLLLLMLLPLLIMIVLQLFSVKEQYERAKELLDFDVSQAVRRSMQQYSIWNSHTSEPDNANSYDAYYVNTDSSFSFMVSQSAQKYPLLDFEADTALPAKRIKQFLRFKEELESTRIKKRPNLQEFYLIRSIQYCKNCTESVKSLADIFPVDSLIKSEIAKQGIKTTAKIAFYNLSEQSYSYLPKAIDSTVFNQTKFKYTFSNNEELRIVLPEKNKQLLANILSTIISALILIAVSIFCFVWARKILVRSSRFEEQKNDFINNVTHELKTPIATISFAVANIENKEIIHQPQQIKQFTRVIQDENDRLNAQVEKVLQIAASQKENFAIKREKVNIHALISELSEAFSIRIRQNGSLKCELTAAHAEVEGDAFHLSNMISNLIDNAIKYSNEEVDIVLFTESDSKGICIKVSDRGKGIDKKDESLIFNKFYRVSQGNLYDVKGFGLGLSYVKEIVERHHGNVTVNSRLGKGSTFSIFLPFDYK